MNKISLVAVARDQLDRARRASSGRSACSVYGGHEHTLRQTLLALSAGTSLAEHDSPGEATLHVLVGRVRLRAGADCWDGHDGDLIKIPSARHELHALEDAAVLLTTVTPHADMS